MQWFIDAGMLLGVLLFAIPVVAYASAKVWLFIKMYAKGVFAIFSLASEG